MKRTPGVYLELLFRPGVRDELRREALAGLAKLDKKTELTRAARRHPRARRPGDARDESVVFDLVRLLTDRPPASWPPSARELEKLATTAKQPVMRQLGFVALIAADGSVDKAWALAIEVGRRAAGPRQRDAADPRPEPAAAPVPEGRAAARRPAAGPGAGEPNGKAVARPLRPHRAARQAADADAGRGRGVQRRPQRRPPGQGVAEEHGPRRRRRAGPSTATRAARTATAARRTPQEDASNPWWEVDLGAELPIESIVIYNRTDGDLGKRLDGFTLKVLDADRNGRLREGKQPGPGAEGRRSTLGGRVAGAGRPPRGDARPDQRPRPGGGDVQGAGAGSSRTTPTAPPPSGPCSASRRRTGRRTRPSRCSTAIARLRPQAAGRPSARRRRPSTRCSSPTPWRRCCRPDEAKAVRKELGELGVRVIRLGTLLEQMLFDKERLVVQAGKPVEFVFENTDLMPHNFVIVQPGSLEEIGKLAEATATQPGALERQYVPQSNKVLLASRLLQPRESQRLSFTAPTKPGVYPYVCTYPGHWRRMYGALYVVDDLDEYLADPEAYLAKNPLPIKDELLKVNRPRTEWKFEDLAGDGREAEGRPLVRQRQADVHGRELRRLPQAGRRRQRVRPGPDQARPEVEKPADILEDILEPSLKINEKYQTCVFELTSGQDGHRAWSSRRRTDACKVIENPLAKAEPIVLKEADIDQKTKSPTSIMPKGLLDKLTRRRSST